MAKLVLALPVCGSRAIFFVSSHYLKVCVILACPGHTRLLFDCFSVMMHYISKKASMQAEYCFVF